MKKRITIAILKTIGSLALFGLWVYLMGNYKIVVLISLIITVIVLGVILFMMFTDN